jgi:hypothetical protein
MTERSRRPVRTTPHRSRWDKTEAEPSWAPPLSAMTEPLQTGSFLNPDRTLAFAVESQIRSGACARHDFALPMFQGRRSVPVQVPARWLRFRSNQPQFIVKAPHHKPRLIKQGLFRLISHPKMKMEINIILIKKVQYSFYKSPLNARVFSVADLVDFEI